jgi:hypothetical protein
MILAPFFSLLPVLHMDGARYLVTTVEYRWRFGYDGILRVLSQPYTPNKENCRKNGGRTYIGPIKPHEHPAQQTVNPYQATGEFDLKGRWVNTST